MLTVTKFLHTTESKPKFFACIDVAQKNAQNEPLFGVFPKVYAERLQANMSLAFKFDASYIAYRQNFVAVTFRNMRTFDKVFAKMLKKEIKEHKWEVVKTPFATIVRIPK